MPGRLDGDGGTPQAGPTDPQQGEWLTRTGLEPKNFLQGQAQNKLLHERSRSYEKNPTFWRAHPMQYGATIASNLPEKTHHDLVTYSPEVHSWIQAKGTLGGVSGALTQVYLKAINIANPTLRGEAIATLNAMKALPTSDQEALISHLQDPSSLDLVGLQGVGFGLGANGSGAADFGPDGLTVHAATTSVDQVVALETLFPALRGKIHFDDSGITTTDVTESLVNSFNPYIAPITGQYKFNDAGYAGIQGKLNINPLNIAETVLATAGGLTLGAAIGATKDVSERIARGTKSIPIIGDITNAEAVLFGAGARLLGTTMGTAGHAIGLAITSPITLVTGHRFDERTTDLWGNVVMAVAMNEFSEGLGAAKQTLTTPAEFAAADLRLGAARAAGDTSGSLTAGALDAVKVSIDAVESASKFGKLGILEHPFKTLVSPVTRSVVYDIIQKIHDTSIEGWVGGGQAGRFFTALEKLKLDHPVDYVQQARQAFPSVPKEALQRVMDVSKDSMGQELLHYQADASHATLRSMNAAANSLSAKLTVLERQITEGVTNSVGPKLPTAPLAEVTVAEARQAVDEAYSKLHETEAQYGPDSPETQAAQTAVADAEATPTVEAREALEGEATAKLNGLERNYQDLIDQRDALRAQAAAQAANQIEPISEFPGRRDMPNFLHRVWYRPTTAVESVFSNILSPKNWLRRAHGTDNILTHDGEWLTVSKQPFIAKLVDKLENDASFSFENPAESLVKRTKASRNNLTVGQRLFQRFGVPVDIYAPIMQQLSDADSYEAFYEVVSKEIFGHEGVLSRYMPKNTATMDREAILGIGAKNPENFRFSVPVKDHLGVATNEPMFFEIRDGVKYELPSIPTQFANDIKLPSASSIENVISRSKRWAAYSKEAAGLKGKASYAMHFGIAMTRAMTIAVKAPALLFNIPAIILTKVLDEFAGNTLQPNLTRSLLPGETDFIIDPAITGNVIAGIFDTGSGVRGVAKVESVPLPYLLSHGKEAVQGVYTSLTTDILELHKDQLMSAFARVGGDESALKALLTGGDESLTRFINENVQPLMDRAGVTLDELIGRYKQTLDEVTLGAHPDFMKLVADGVLGGQARGIIHDGRGWSEQYKSLERDTNTLRDSMADLNPRNPADAAVMRAKQAELYSKLEAIDHLEELGAQADFGTTTLNMKDPITTLVPKRIAREIEARFNSNEVKLPDMLRVDKFLKGKKAGLDSLPELANDISGRFSDYLYNRDGRLSFKAIGRAEGRYARGAFYTQRAEQAFASYKALGMADDVAREFAIMKAAAMTKDYFYDLTARSTLERQVRNIFWFAPVNGELLYRWLYAIPSRSGALLPGAALMVARVKNWEALLLNAGIMHKDEVTGEDVIPIPGVSEFIAELTNGQVRIPKTLNLPVTSLSKHLSSPVPNLSPLYGTTLVQASHYVPVLKDIAAVIAPHADITFVPYAIRNVLGLMGVNLPDLSNMATQSQWNGLHDQAIQYAYWDVNQGYLQPQLKDFIKEDPTGQIPNDAERAAYMAAWTPWNEEIQRVAATYQRGLYSVAILSGSLLPGTLQTSSPEKDAYKVFLKDHILPQIAASGGGAMDQATRDIMNTWLSQNPESQAFAISYNHYTGRDIHTTVDAVDPKYYKELFAQGVKEAMPPADYMEFISAMTSFQHYTQQQANAINAVAPSGNWSDLVKNWYTHSQAVTNKSVQWENYLVLHPKAAVVIDENRINIAKQFGDVATNTIETHYVVQAMTAMKALAGFFIGADGLPNSEFSGALSQIKALNADLYVQTGGKLTPMEQGVSNYFDKVISPYMEASKPLYDQAAKLTAASRDASAIYDQISVLKTQYDGVAVGGIVSPGVDEFFYGSKPPLGQKYAKTHWTTQPISWLSPYQRKTIGYEPFSGEDDMWNQMSKIRATATASIDSAQATAGSNAYSDIISWRDGQLSAVANQYGEAGVKALGLELADPYVRLQATGFFAHNASIQQVFQMADTVHTSLAAVGLSVSGYGPEAADLKYWMYSYIAQQEQVDPVFKRAMEQMSFSMKADSSGNHPTGVPLYEAMFFGNFSSGLIPAFFIENAPTGGV